MAAALAFTGAAAFAATSCAGERPPLLAMPEPHGLWLGPLHGQTPATLAGATVVDQPEVAKLVGEHAVLIDVANLDRQPPGQPKDMPWTPIHRSIPGADWMPGAGSGTAEAAFATAFAARVETLTGGDKDKPIVTFCHPARWGSWNVAKRLTLLGYRHVYWFPLGAEGWQDRAAAADAEPDPAWTAAYRKLVAAGDDPAKANAVAAQP